MYQQHNPRARGLPYSEYRPYQLEAIEWLETPRLDDKEQPVAKIAEMPTGSGKSAIALAPGGMWSKKKAIALTHTRNLQVQYQRVFNDCFVHWGKASYPCIHDERVAESATAEECLYPKAPRQCDYYESCPYYLAKARSTVEPRVALNYAYWLTSAKHYEPNYLILDEAHSLSDITLEHVGVTVPQHDLDYWHLPPFPELTPREIAIYTGGEDSTEVLTDWLERASGQLLDISGGLDDAIKNNYRLTPSKKQAMMSRSRAARSLGQKYEAVLSAFNTNSGEHWFIRCDESQSFYKGKAELALNMRPLTARHDFVRLFNKPKAQLLLMSATIGNIEIYAQELGITDYDWHVVPNRWPPESRPVHILPVPSMGRKSAARDPEVWNVQARVIADAILAQPHDWCGLVLVTRKTEVVELSKRLAGMGLAERIYPMVDDVNLTVPTEEQLRLWNERKIRQPNSIGVSASMWTGFDGVKEKLLIIAKIPFPSLSSEYERSRLSYSGNTFYWRTACMLEQGLGRTRRGNYEDYEVDGLHQGFVAIADADWKRVRNFLSKSLLDAIVELPKL